eukprot:7641247-Ditylum_brightwellii.AAC.1
MFTPSQWENAIGVMLEKDPGNPLLTSLRFIIIIEGDMKRVIKVIWNRQLVPVAEKANFLSQAQSGNHKERTALDALLLEVVMMEYLQLFRLNDALLNNDATTCYDRMIPE